MEIKCRNCYHVETVNISFFVKIIGGALPIGGFWAWTTYLLAGTGLALPIVSRGGTSILFTSIAFGIILSASRTVYTDKEDAE